MRLPLQTGGKSMRRLPVFVLVAVVIGAVYGRAHAVELTGSTLMSAWDWFKWLVCCPFFTFILAGILLGDRASDCAFDHEGLRIIGGVQSGLRVYWSDLREEDVRVVERSLALHLGDGVSIDFPSAGSPAEERSLEALRSTLAFHLRQNVGSSPCRAPTSFECLNPEVLRCENCGTPAVVDDAEQVTCLACSEKVTVGAPMRERIRVARELGPVQQSVAQLIDKAQSQATAKFANSILGVVTLLGVVWLPLPITFGNIPLFVVSAFIFLVAYLFALPFIASRRALLVLGTDHASVNVNGGNLCCACGAPLCASQAHEIVVRCVYCQTSNVLGLDFVHERKQAQQTHLTLEASYLQHQRSMSHFRWVIAGAVCVLALLSYMAWEQGAMTSDRYQPEPGIEFGTYCHEATCTFAGLDGDSRRTLRRVSNSGKSVVLIVSANARFEELSEVSRLATVTELRMAQLYSMGTLDPTIFKAFTSLNHLTIDTRNFASLEPLYGLTSLVSLCVQRELPVEAVQALKAALPRAAVTRFPCF